MTRAMLLALLLAPLTAGSADLPVFDAHLHYSHDAWDTLPPRDVIAILKEAGVRRALISSSGDDGQQRLKAEAPELVMLELRPYRSRGDTGTWMRDVTVPAYLEERLKKFRYAGIGEFHLYGADADLPVPRRMVELAKQYGLLLHAHSDADAVERLFRQWPQARVLWAHSGGKVDAEWRKAFIEFPDRFLLGTDTFTPERWHYVVEHARWSREWLADLPTDVAERIAWKNGEALFAPGK